MKKENEKSDWKETQRSCKKKERKVFFFFWKKCSARKKRRLNMRRVDREREWTSGGYIQGEETWKESKYGEKETRNIRLRMRKIKGKEMWTGKIFVNKEYQ